MQSIDDFVSLLAECERDNPRLHGVITNMTRMHYKRLECFITNACEVLNHRDDMSEQALRQALVISLVLSPSNNDHETL
jgi:hypothetical protein